LIKDNQARTFRNLLSSQSVVVAPGAFGPSVALLAKKTGFKALYFSGAAFSNFLGLPDIGVTTLSEVTAAVTAITSRVDLPLIVDVDTGFGEAVNVIRTVSEMERANAAAIQIEDQVMPKRCGHLAGKQVVEAEEMVKKVIAAKDAVKHDLVIIARTDAAAIEGLDSAIARAKLYVKAGADVIFPEALTTEAEFKEFAKKVRVPLLANMTEFGKTPYYTVSQFAAMGYKVVIFPVTTFRTMMKAVQDSLNELARQGSQKGILGRMMTREEFYGLIDYYRNERVDKETAKKARKLLDSN
jgi:methylisocitrate lyase